MDSAACRYAGLNVPRHASYPTAADFAPGETAGQHAAWLGGLDPEEGDGYAQNITDVPKYIRAIESGSLASARGYRSSEEDRQGADHRAADVRF